MLLEESAFLVTLKDYIKSLFDIWKDGVSFLWRNLFIFIHLMELCFLCYACDFAQQSIVLPDNFIDQFMQKYLFYFNNLGIESISVDTKWTN